MNHKIGELLATLGFATFTCSVANAWQCDQICPTGVLHGEYECATWQKLSCNGSEKKTAGCGSGLTADLIKNNYGPIDFTSACNTHDACYDTCNANKDICDLDFKNNMYAVCKARTDIVSRETCYSLASDYYYAMSASLVRNAFDEAQAKVCSAQPAQTRTNSPLPEDSVQASPPPPPAFPSVNCSEERWKVLCSGLLSCYGRQCGISPDQCADELRNAAETYCSQMHFGEIAPSAFSPSCTERVYEYARASSGSGGFAYKQAQKNLGCGIAEPPSPPAPSVSIPERSNPSELKLPDCRALGKCP